MPLVTKKVRPDAKGRISLGKLAPYGVSSYTVSSENGRIILEPNVEIPAKDKWLWDNKTAVSEVKEGLEGSSVDPVENKGDFTRFIDDEE